MAPFQGIKPDKPAFVADLSYWYEAMQSKGSLPVQYQAEAGYLQLHRDLGVCAYYGLNGTVYSWCYDGVEEHTAESALVRIKEWRLPRGILREKWEYVPEGCCWAHTGYAASTADDLKLVQDLAKRMRFAPDEKEFRRLAEHLGEDGVPISPVPRSPLPALLADWCGVMNTVYLVADETAAVEDTLSAIDQANDSAFEASIQSSAKLFHFCDNLDSGNCASLFDRYLKVYYQRRLRQLHEAGKYAVVHLDGAVRGLLPRLAECGFDGVESLTPAPVGDVTIAGLRAVAKNPDTILWGGIPGAMFAPPWTAAQIAEHTRQLLQTLAGQGRLIVGSADQVPPNGNLDFCRLIADTVENHLCRN